MAYTFKESPYSSHARLLQALPSHGDGRRVLDVGCGDGYLGKLLAERGYHVTGVEREGGFSSQFPTNVELVVADLESGLPVLPNSYDFVLCADILEHLRYPDVLLRQIRRVLAPDGIVIASLPNSGNVWFRASIFLGHFPQDEKGLFDRTHLRFFMWKGWQRLFADSDFRILSVEPTSIPVSLVVPPRWAGSLAVHWAESVCYGLAGIRKTLFAYQFVIRAEPQQK
ncbi:MAG: class I SAM-dependent methyltransferase [Bryobacteraceae bacterium]|nr:class I SAM-dependent methyltransferase [Bryobacteraceae bacterium]